MIAAVGMDTLYRLIGTHGKWEEELAPIGLTVEPLPFPVAVWLIGTGENASGNLVSGRDRKPITVEVTDGFGLERTGIVSVVRTNAELAARRGLRKLNTRGSS